jgi:predicted transcriptional regulator
VSHRDLMKFDTHSQGSYPQGMKVQLSVEQEAELSRIADETGRSTDELASEAVGCWLTEEIRIRAGVQTGLDAADRGDFVRTDEVWARVERALNS